MDLPRIAIVDFGSQYTHQIACSLRRQGFLAVIVTPEDELTELDKGVILSGGPGSVTQSELALMGTILERDVPVLGICFGMQLIASFFGANVRSNHQSEFGPSLIQQMGSHDYFVGCPGSDWSVWMSHNDSVDLLGCDTGLCGIHATEGGGVASIYVIDRPTVCGVQFHPEVAHTRDGDIVLRNFAEACQLEPGVWSQRLQLRLIEEQIKREVAEDDRIILALSGGVDSMVTAALLARTIDANQWRAVLVDHGFMREGEVRQIKATCEALHIPLQVIDHHHEFYYYLKGISDPEHKRRLIGTLFINAFQVAQRSFKPTMLAQGTIYPDVVESAKGGTKQHTIKSHHNVGGLPNDLELKLLEPIRMLFKNEVRELGAELGLPQSVLQRHPFPGPGLAIRVVGAVTERKVDIVRRADHIFMTAIEESGHYNEVSQAYAALLDSKAVGVVGDQRRFGWIIVLRAVYTQDFMTASVFPFQVEWLQKIASQIVNECQSVARVTFDITPKPPGTIEME